MECPCLLVRVRSGEPCPRGLSFLLILILVYLAWPLEFYEQPLTVHLEPNEALARVQGGEGASSLERSEGGEPDEKQHPRSPNRPGVLPFELGSIPIGPVCHSRTAAAGRRRLLA